MDPFYRPTHISTGRFSERELEGFREVFSRRLRRVLILWATALVGVAVAWILTSNGVNLLGQGSVRDARVLWLDFGGFGFFAATAFYVCRCPACERFIRPLEGRFCSYCGTPFR